MKRALVLCGIAAFGTTALAVAGGCGRSQRCYGQELSVSPRSYEQDRAVRVTHNSPCADDGLIGPRGPDGPAGPVGEQGPTGQTGAAGYAMAGPRGEPGSMGNVGEQGPTGASGAPGVVVRGPAGPQGPAGNAGALGASGDTGARGESAPGYVGASGPQGPTGPQGEIGMTGVRGATTVGPTGPAGRSGPAGAQGATGYAGAQGSTTLGVAGATGLTGAQGPQGAVGAQGPTGPIGAQGQMCAVDRWTSFRDFWFQSDSAEIQNSERSKLTEIAIHMNQNPSLQIGIDGSMDPRGTEPRNQHLSELRVKAIRDALVRAGVPTNRIREGAYGNSNERRDRRVEVLIASAK